MGDFNVDLNQTINSDLKEQAGKEGKKQIAQLLREKHTIWVDCHWKQSIIFCKTKDMDLRTGSNHQAVVAQLETGLSLQKRSQAENRRARRKRLEIDMENVNEKDWDEYRLFLSKELKGKLSKDIGKENAQTDNLDYQILESKTLDELWDIIESSIKKSAANTLPQKKKMRVIEDITNTNEVTKKLRKDIRTLGKWCRRLRKNKEKGISYQEVEELERFIEPLKNRWSLEVVEYELLLEEVTEEEWQEALEQTKGNSALGVSGITYPMIKKANRYTKEIFRYLASRCLKE
ncbi:22379_t:CDS:2, partial [Gigaspora margarita]